MKKLIVAVGLLIGLCGCEKTSKDKIAVTNADLVTPPEMLSKAKLNKPVPPGSADQEGVTRKIIKEGEISFETKNIPETRNAIYNSLQNLGGYVAEENETNDTTSTQKEYVLKVRIPEKNFEQFLNAVSSNAVKIDSKSIRARDVTSQYIDYTNELANKRKLEDRYVELLKKGTKISDLLEIENKITQIQTTIDSIQGQLNYLVKQVDYSSLDITFYTKQTIKDNQQTFGTKLVGAFLDGWNILIVMFFGFTSVWPIWVIIILIYIFYKIRKRKKAKDAV